MLRNKILRGVAGSSGPTEIIGFGDLYVDNNASSTPTLSVPVSYSAGDLLFIAIYAYDSTISTIELTGVSLVTFNGNSGADIYSPGNLSNTSAITYSYVAQTSDTSLSVYVPYTSSPQHLYCGVYVMQSSLTSEFSKARQTWTTGTSDTSISYEEDISGIVGIALYREDSASPTTPFSVSSTVGSVDEETAQIIDGSGSSGNAGAMMFNLPYTQTSGSSSLTLTSTDSSGGTTRKAILVAAF